MCIYCKRRRRSGSIVKRLFKISGKNFQFIAICQHIDNYFAAVVKSPLSKFSLERRILPYFSVWSKNLFRGYGIARCYNPSQKFLDTLRRNSLPRFPSFNVAPMMSTFLSIFFEPAKQHWAGGMGKKGSHCPMLLSEIVWTSYAKYVVSFYIMWISTLLQSHVRAPPVQRWRCTILNKIITGRDSCEITRKSV